VVGARKKKGDKNGDGNELEGETSSEEGWVKRGGKGKSRD
jgi:hypothetical protein